MRISALSPVAKAPASVAGALPKVTDDAGTPFAVVVIPVDGNDPIELGATQYHQP